MKTGTLSLNSTSHSALPVVAGLLIAIAFALACLWLLPRARAVSPAPDAADADVRDTLQRLYAAWSDLAPAKAAPFYAKDADLVFFDIAPMK